MLEVKGFALSFVWCAVDEDEFVGEAIEENSVGAACTDVAAADDGDASALNGQRMGSFRLCVPQRAAYGNYRTTGCLGDDYSARLAVR